MASAKDLKKKIRSIANTKKITRTMEMVAAAKSKRTQARVTANTPYSRKLGELLSSLSKAAAVKHYLLEEPEGVRRDEVLVITANRGLCGGYNSGVLALAEQQITALREEGREVDVSMIGKKGITRFRFRRIPMRATYTHIEDRPSFEDAETLAESFMERLRAGEVARVFAVSTRYLSAGSQKPQVVQILPIRPQPIGAPAGTAKEDTPPARGAVEFLFEPDPASILETLLPFSVKNLVYRLLIEAAASEQIARRVAMKLATDNAEELIRSYTRKYHRQRQAGITQQITEIVSGAQALE